MSTMQEPIEVATTSQGDSTPPVGRVCSSTAHAARVCVALAVGFLAFYYAFQNVGYFDAGDAYTRYDLVKAMYERNSVKVVIPPSTELTPARFSTGSVLVTIPFYAATKLLAPILAPDTPIDLALIRAALFTTILWTALWMSMVWLLAQQFGASPRNAFWLALIAGVVTLIFPYSKSFQTENYMGLLVTGSLYAAIRARRSGSLCWTAIMGFLFGLCVTVKPEYIVSAPLLAIYVFAVHFHRGRTHVIATMLTAAAAALPGAAWVLLYNYLRYGGVLTDGYEELPFNHPLFLGMYVQFLSPGKGLMWYCPVLWVSVFCLPKFIQRFRWDAVLALGTVLSMLCLYSKYYMPDADTALGPRFMVSYIPLLLLPMLLWLQRSDKSMPLRRVVSWLITVSLGLQFMHSLVSFLNYFHGVIMPLPVELREPARMKMHYTIEHSPLIGNFLTLTKGLLDCRFVSWMPAEGRLTISPVFWYCLALAAFSWTLCLYWTRRPEPQGIVHSPYVIYGGFGVCALLVLAGAAKLPDHRKSGLLLEYSSGGKVYARTIVKDINNRNEILDKTLCMFLHKADATCTWTGTFKAPEAGEYEFALEAESTMTLSIDKRLVAQRLGWEPEITTGVIHLLPGEHSIRAVHDHYGYHGGVQVWWQPPGKQRKPLEKARLQHR